MNGKPESGLTRRQRLSTGILLAALAAAIFATPGFAADWRKGEWRISWDNTVTYGVSFRTEDPDPALIGLVNGGTAFSVNGDDGDLNYDTGIWSNVLKLSSEVEIERGNFGVFVRGFGFYDTENEDGDRERTALTSAALDRVGSRAELRDAYAWYRFRIGAAPSEVRVGEQVVSWGESTFIQGGINSINPVDVSSLRSPGAELKDALLPVGIVFGSVSPTANTSIELFYQYNWDPIEIDPPGSYFSTSDFAGDGGSTVFLGFGSSADTPPFSDPSDPQRPFLGVPRMDDIEPDDQGQYGVAFRWLVPSLGDTEFGFYYENLHSRLPLINGRTGTVAGAVTAGTIGAAATPIVTATLTYLGMNPGDIPGAIAAGTAAGVMAGAPQGASTAIAATAAQGGDVPSITTAFATDAYAQTARYQLGYPEDIKLYGVSFNALLGTTGVALQGELSYRTDAPLQIDDVELLFAALEPINPVFAGAVPAGASQITSYTGVNYSTAFETFIPGFIQLDVSQFQTTATKIWSQVLGAQQFVVLFEGAVTRVHSMPSTDELRLEAPGTYTSGNPYHENGMNPGAAHAGKPAEDAKYFADPTSWGYRLVGRLQYDNAIGAISVSPRVAWGHDVSGNSPGPGGNFLEGRKAVTVGVGFDFQSTWSADLSYTDFSGAGRHNLISDRDFIAANLKYSF